MARNRDLAKIPFETLGGTTGQLLAKTSNTDYDFEWIDNTVSFVEHNVKAGQAINKGQAVYVSSATGTNMIVVLANNLTEATSSKTLGLCKQNLANNGQGFVVTEGLLTGSGSAPLNTGSANAGDPVWLGESGNLIFGLVNKPYAPKHLVFIGIVTRAHSVNGEIFVKVQNGFELKELHDVQAKTPNDLDTLYFDATDSQWKTNQVSTLLGAAGGDLTGTYPSPTIAPGSVTLGKMNKLAPNSIIGNNTGSPIYPLALSVAEVTAMLNVFTSTLNGLVPASGGGNTKFLRADGTWIVPSGGGGSSQNLETIVAWDGNGSLIIANASTTRYAVLSNGGTISGWSIVAIGTNPTCTIDIYYQSSGTTLPSASICASALPSLSTGNVIKSTTLTGWTTTTLVEGGTLGFTITAASRVQQLKITLIYA
jgi:hypothetical protein